MADSYRPGDRGRDRDRAPPLTDRMTFQAGPDHYRPGGPYAAHGHVGNQRQFTYESNYQSTYPSPHFPPTAPTKGDSRGPPRKRPRGGASFRDARRDRLGRSNTNALRRGGYRKAAPHERALLQHRDDGTPERAMGISDGPNRFLDLEDLSDDDEADMDVESHGSASEDGEVDGHTAKHKVARTDTNSRADGNSVPKWSNPDPYTVLPPPEETTGKKTDFVKLIRKAKNRAAEKDAAHNAVAANDDFISFGNDDDDDDGPGSSALPSQQHPSSHHATDIHDDRELPDDAPCNPPQIDERLHHPAQNKKRKFAGHGPGIVDEWLGRPNMLTTPWLPSPQAYRHLGKDPDKWLHNEILDFYDFVSPQPYEHTLRNQLVNRVQNALGNHRFPHDTGRILCFGSFPAGLYLPTADMDLVYTSDQHYNGGPPVLDLTERNAHGSLLKSVRKRLQQTHMSIGQVVVIPGAKVPLVKFTDSYTRLQVDISFENLSGVQAQATFAHWKEKYPDMVYMVALLKQFLVMRGLNEVHTGGLGGFSIICLVVHYIHQVQKVENLGELFKGFLDYYGNKFDLTRQRIQMNPPGVVDKVCISQVDCRANYSLPALTCSQTRYGVDDREEKPFGLSIQDPNRPNNNISGGSHKAQDVFRAFATAHSVLEDRMTALRSGHDIGGSLLGCILGGNYHTYLAQRRLMKSLK